MKSQNSLEYRVRQLEENSRNSGCTFLIVILIFTLVALIPPVREDARLLAKAVITEILK